LILSAGLGEWGAQPLAATMNEGVFLGVEVDRARIKRRLETGYLDVMVDRLEDALILALGAKKRNSKVDWSGWKCSRIHPEIVKEYCSRSGDRPDISS
jgi:urocanate hydratase